METDRLLVPVPAEDWSHVVIRVTVKVRRLIYGDMDLGSQSDRHCVAIGTASRGRTAE